jgi:RHS repeat-associated protein
VTCTHFPVNDLGSGVPREVTDPNKYITITSYDPLGRIVSVSQPVTDPDKPGTPAWTFAYTLHFSGVGRITEPAETLTRQLMSDSDGKPRWLDSYAYLDGYGRTVQTQTPSPGGGRMIDATWYNSQGLTSAATAQPYHDDKAAGSELDSIAFDKVGSLTRTRYDALQRPVTVALYSLGKFKWQTLTRYAADVTIVTPPSGGATATWTDGHGRTSMIQQNYPIRRGSPPLDMATTRYTWTAGGNLATITGPAGSVYTYTYDWAGNKIAASDPDAGASTYTYNPAGQLTSSTDADGTTISTTYDILGRQTSQWDGQPGTGTELTAWTYDKTPGGIGQPTETDTYHDGHLYASDLITSYDRYYNTTGERISIAGTQYAALNQAYDYGYAYDLAGHQTSTTYPQAGGLPAETVHTGYSNQGLPDNLTSNLGGGFTYIPGVVYDSTGQLASRDYGKDADIRRTYRWDDATGQITGVATTVHGDAHPVQDDTYTWDPSGNLRSDYSQDPGPSGTPQPQYQCYGYDNFPRLTTAWTTTSGTGCSTGIRGADTLGGNPYQQTWAYDIAGNMTSFTTGSQVTAYTYPAPTAPQPHAPVTAGTSSYRYDADGQMTRRTTDGTREYLDWTPQGQLAQISGPNGDSSFTYDAAGNRLVRTTPQGTTLYLPSTELTADASGSTVTGSRDYTIGGATIAVRTTPTTTDPDGPLTWMMADTQGSAQLTIPASSGSAAAIQWYLPYGTIRGPRTITVTDHGYLGRPLDAATGLIADGARYYDPVSGHFISPDPIINPTSPDSLNAYAYADGNPATYTDPTGLRINVLPGQCADNACNGVNWAGGAPPPNAPPVTEPGAPIQTSTANTVIETPPSEVISDSAYYGGGVYDAEQAGWQPPPLPSVPAEPAPAANSGCGTWSLNPICIYQGAVNDVDIAKHGIGVGYNWVGQASGAQALANCVTGPTVAGCTQGGIQYSMSLAGLAGGGLLAGAKAGVTGLVGTGGEGVGAVTRVFWTGGDEAKIAATKFATENGGETLGMTTAGKALEAATEGMDWADAKPLWDAASGGFARGASGTVHVFINLDSAWEGSIWAQTEFPALVDNQNVPDVVFHLLGG